MTKGRTRHGPLRRAATWIALTGAVSAAPVAAQDLLYVASQEEVTVAVIDMASKQLVETVDLKELGYAETAKAHHTAVEPDGSHWYVSLIAAGKVLKFDRQNRLVGEADFQAPGMLSLDPTDDRLYVGRSMAAVNPPQRVGVIQRSTMEIEEVDVFFPRPHALIVDPHGQRFFSASLGQNSVAYAPLGAEEVDLLNLGGDDVHVLVQFAVSPDGRHMVGTGQMTGDLLVFDLTGDEPRVVHSLDVGGPTVASELHAGRVRRVDSEPGLQPRHGRRHRELDGRRRDRASCADRAARVGGVPGRVDRIRVVAQRLGHLQADGRQ